MFDTHWPIRILLYALILYMQFTNVVAALHVESNVALWSNFIPNLYPFRLNS